MKKNYVSCKHCELLKGEVRFLKKILSKDGYCMDPTEMTPVQALTDHKPKTVGTQTKVLGFLLPTTLHKHSQTILLPAVHWKHTRLWSPMTRCEKGQRTIKPSIPFIQSPGQTKIRKYIVGLRAVRKKWAIICYGSKTLNASSSLWKLLAIK